MSSPTAEDQIQFLANFQRLISEGQFVASYKFALLLALTNVAIEKGDDSGASLVVSVRDLAEQFVRLYWRQTAPFAGARRQAFVLKQNTGRQAAVISELVKARQAHESMAVLRGQPRRWSSLLTQVGRTIEGMPLWRLQVVGGEAFTFMYEHAEGAQQIELKAGVAFCLRRFHILIHEVVQNAWIRFLRRLPENQEVLGEVNELADFLFGTDRSTLTAYQAALTDVDGSRCFYCESPLRERVEVDHFIPWSRYALDLGHNFVLAHPACNNSKSDRLASSDHLRKWCARNDERRLALDESFNTRGLLHSEVVSRQIARWAYSQAEAANAHVWVAADTLIRLDQGWRSYLMA